MFLTPGIYTVKALEKRDTLGTWKCPLFRGFLYPEMEL